MTTSSVSSSLPSNIMTTSKYSAQQTAHAYQAATSMGEGAFLTLFTTQLQNQDPLNPTDNSNFVAQLAQFSQLEATTSMQTSMSGLVNTLSNNQLVGAASLIGKNVLVPNGAVSVTSNSVSQGVVNLPSAADSVTVQVVDSSGNLVNTLNLGAQPAGDISINWDGTDSTGKAVNTGTYAYVASVVSGGKTTTPTVSTYCQVQNIVSSGTTNGGYLLDVAGGTAIPLSSVTSVSQ